MIRWGVIVLIGCASQEAATITSKELVGAYDLRYAPATGEPIEFEREKVVFNSRLTVPECCFGIWRRTETSLELGVGNRSPSPEACSPLVHVRISVEGVLAAAPQEIEIGPTNARAMLFHSEPAPPCPRALDPHSVRGASIELAGKLQLPVFHCEDEPHVLGCALIAKGSWELSSSDGRFDAHGWFESNDTIAPLTF